jgi:hypothetical protein
MRKSQRRPSDSGFSDEDSHGRESERLTQAIASIRFLADFSFPNPTYKKAGLSREFADLLVTVGDTLLVFQVKSHLARPQSKHDEDRAHRKILNAFRQFRVMIEATSDQGLDSIRNRRGLNVPFNLRSFDKIFFIVVLHYIQEADALPKSFRSMGFNEVAMPLSLRAFEAKDFFFLAHQLDTVPDFTAFLYLLHALELSHPKALGMNLADLLAFLHLYRSEMLDLIDNGAVPAHLRPGIFEDFRPRAQQFEFPESYMIDEILEQFHTAVGADAILDEPLRGLRVPLNSVEAYWHTANALAGTFRAERQEIASLLIQKRKAAVERGHAYGAVWIENRGEAVIVHSSCSSRRDRMREMGGLALALHAKHDLKSVLVIGAPPGEYFDNHDVLSLRKEWISDIDSVKADLGAVPIFAEPRPTAL